MLNPFKMARNIHLVALAKWSCKCKDTPPSKIVQIKFHPRCLLLFCGRLLMDFSLSSWCLLLWCLLLNRFHRWRSHGSKKYQKFREKIESERGGCVEEGHVFFILYFQCALALNRVPYHHRIKEQHNSFYLRNLNVVATHFYEILLYRVLFRHQWHKMPSNKTPINQNYQLNRRSFLTLYFLSFTTQ